MSTKPEMDEIVLILNQQAVALQRARMVNLAMSKSIRQTQEDHEYAVKKYNSTLVGLKRAYFRLLKEMTALKNSEDNPTIIVKSIPTRNEENQENKNTKNTKILIPSKNRKGKNDAKTQLSRERKISIQMEEANKFLAASAALHRPLTPSLIPEEEFVYHPGGGWNKVIKEENNKKAFSVYNIIAPNNNKSGGESNNSTPFVVGGVQALEGSKILKKPSIVVEEERSNSVIDPLAEYRINCGPMYQPSSIGG